MKLFRLIPFAFLAVTLAAQADDRRIIDEASVLKADPVYRTVEINEPVEQCWEEQVRIQDDTGHKSYTPHILGALVGAAVGNEFGRGRGKDLATAAGAVLGGSIGRDVQASNSKSSGSRIVKQTRCEMVDQYRTEDQLVGYDVTYRYNGKVFSAFTPYDPGSVLTVSVSVLPAE